MLHTYTIREANRKQHLQRQYTYMYLYIRIGHRSSLWSIRACNNVSRVKHTMGSSIPFSHNIYIRTKNQAKNKKKRRRHSLCLLRYVRKKKKKKSTRLETLYMYIAEEQYYIFKRNFSYYMFCYYLANFRAIEREREYMASSMNKALRKQT